MLLAVAALEAAVNEFIARGERVTITLTNEEGVIALESSLGGKAQEQRELPVLTLPYDLEEVSKERAECLEEEGIQPPKGWTLQDVVKVAFLNAANTQLAYTDEGVYVDQDEAIKEILEGG